MAAPGRGTVRRFGPFLILHKRLARLRREAWRTSVTRLSSNSSTSQKHRSRIQTRLLHHRPQSPSRHSHCLPPARAAVQRRSRRRLRPASPPRRLNRRDPTARPDPSGRYSIHPSIAICLRRRPGHLAPKHCQPPVYTRSPPSWPRRRQSPPLPLQLHLTADPPPTLRRRR